ncbi:MAG: hypothetical protein ACOYON_00650 [Fimbriimonas sp.]
MITTPFLTLLLAQSGAPNALLESCVQRMRSLALEPSKAVVVRSKVTTGTTLEQVFDLAYSGDRLRVALAVAATPQSAGSNRTYYLEGAKFLAIEPDATEWLSRTVSARATRLQRLEQGMGRMDDAVRILLSPAAVSEIVGPLAAAPNWRAQTRANETVLTRGPIQGVDTTVKIDNQRRLTSLRINSQGSIMQWEYRYGAAKPLAAARVPSGYRRVDAFTAMPLPPRYANAGAEKVGSRILRTYGALKRGEIVVTEDGSRRTILVGSGKLAQIEPKQAFVFDGKSLSFRVARASRSGAAKRTQVLDRLAAAGFKIDPFARNYLTRTVPFQNILKPGTSVKIDGTVVVNGVPCDIVLATAPTFRVSMFVRRTDGLVQSLTSEAIDPRGRTASRSVYAYEYKSLGKTPPSSRFRL